jgi:hypothetical protein
VREKERARKGGRERERHRECERDLAMRGTERKAKVFLIGTCSKEV